MKITDLPTPKLIRNARTDEGAALGVELARLCDNAEPQARLVEPMLPTRCNSCAFRAGPHVANGSPQTLIAAIDAAARPRETLFECHEPNRLGCPCAGWLFFLFADEHNKRRSAQSSAATPEKADNGEV